MRRSALVGLAFALFALGAPGGASHAEERIRSFHAELSVTRDGRFTVEETLLYDFGSERRRGIYRDVPVRYGRGQAADYRISLDVLSVTDGNGNPLPYRDSSEGRQRRIRIGDPNRTVTGQQTYRLTYRVRRGILWLEEHDELYWNVTGNGWRVPIDAADARVRLPGDAAVAAARTTCYTGPQGAVLRDCDHQSMAGGLEFRSRRGLGAGEGLTLVVGVPKGMLDEPSKLARLLDRASDWIGFTTALPVLVLLGMTTWWWRNGRDPSGPVAIPVRYEPPEGMTPAELGTVLDEKADLRDLTATILDLAVRGYLEIEELESKRFLFLQETDYRLLVAKPADDALKEHERVLLQSLFTGKREVRTSDLKNKFYKRLPVIREALYAEVSKRGRWFPGPPDRVRNRYAVAAAVVIACGALSLVVLKNLPLALSLAASGAVVFLLGRHMPRKTRLGRRARQHILGFQEFLERVEVDRLERLGKRNVSEFERLLPFAFVLGAADEWAQAFADLYTEPPSWYHSRHGGSFRPRGFVADVGRSLDSVGSAMRSQPRQSGGSGSSGFGGGGFSGGGFGGGGGGSW